MAAPQTPDPDLPPQEATSQPTNPHSRTTSTLSRQSSEANKDRFSVYSSMTRDPPGRSLKEAMIHSHLDEIENLKLRIKFFEDEIRDDKIIEEWLTNAVDQAARYRILQDRIKGLRTALREQRRSLDWHTRESTRLTAAVARSTSPDPEPPKSPVMRIHDATRHRRQLIKTDGDWWYDSQSGSSLESNA
ncbi:MAG: hypothetical protein M1815_002555 [Lichina confinis]|nr:MAG: hypothetical protein M1815_002555 [Lichina confinis]